MKCTILGTGDTEGHPIITKLHEYCLPGENKLRPGFLVENASDAVVFDTSPDIRQQLLKTEIDNISAIFITHQHFDHLWGIADIFQLSWAEKIDFPIFVNNDTLLYIRKFIPWIELPFQVYEFNHEYNFNGFSVTPIQVGHSKQFLTSGFLVKSLASGKSVFYAPDITCVENSVNVECSASVVDGTFFFGKYIDDNDEHLPPNELKTMIDSWHAESNYIISLAPYYYSKNTNELRKQLPKKYFIPDDFTSFEI